MEDILDFRRENFVYNKFLVGGISNNFVEWVSFNLVPWFPFFFLIKNIFPHHPTTSKRKHYQRRKLQQKHLGQAELQMEQGKRQKHALRNHWINSGQIIAGFGLQPPRGSPVTFVGVRREPWHFSIGNQLWGHFCMSMISLVLRDVRGQYIVVHYWYLLMKEGWMSTRCAWGRHNFFRRVLVMANFQKNISTSRRTSRVLIALKLHGNLQWQRLVTMTSFSFVTLLMWALNSRISFLMNSPFGFHCDKDHPQKSDC